MRHMHKYPRLVKNHTNFPYFDSAYTRHTSTITELYTQDIHQQSQTSASSPKFLATGFCERRSVSGSVFPHFLLKELGVKEALSGGERTRLFQTKVQPSNLSLLICLRNMLMQPLLSEEAMEVLCILVFSVSLDDFLKSFCRRHVLFKDVSMIFDLTQAVFLACD